jgi:3-methyladenine DNA glycosylase AlkD
MVLKKIKAELRKYSSRKKAKTIQGFFKTGRGEYAEGDIFLGVSVPDIRRIACRYINLPVKHILVLLKSPIHEERLLALLIFVLRYAKGNSDEKKKIYNLYLTHTKHINNWDLVDLTADKIVGAFLDNKSKKPIYNLAYSNNLWERRIAIVSTFHFIKNNKFTPTLRISKLLLKDEHDLIHKAVGWMLREVGKRNRAVEERFLRQHYRIMPRTMLRYAIEHFPQKKRLSYLKGSI